MLSRAAANGSSSRNVVCAVMSGTASMPFKRAYSQGRLTSSVVSAVLFASQPHGRALHSSSVIASYLQRGTLPHHDQLLARSKAHAAVSVLPKRFYASLPEHKVVKLPALSPTMETGNVVSWSKKIGDKIEEGDLLCEIETDKATVGCEAGDEGFLAKIILPEGTKGAKVGVPLCVVVESEGDVGAFANYDGAAAGGEAPAPAASSAPPPPPPSAPKASAGANLPHHKVLKLPSLSPTMSTGNVASWSKKIGEKVEEGDLLCEIETDKATVGFEAGDEGYLAKIILPEGTKAAKVGVPLCVLVDSEGDVGAFANYDPSDEPAPAAAAPAPSTSSSAPPPPHPHAGGSSPAPAASASAPASGGRTKATPYAKKLAADSGVSLANVQGSGPGGRVLAADILNAAKSQPAGGRSAPSSAPAPAAGAVSTAVPTGQTFTVPADASVKAAVPHYYLTSEIVVDQVLDIAKQLKALLPKEQSDLTVTDFLIKAIGISVGKVPEANSFFLGEVIRQNNDVNIAVNVTDKSGNSLAPVVRNVQSKGLSSIHSEIEGLKTRAASGSLQATDLEGATFSVTRSSAQSLIAVLRPPQSCNLSIGTPFRVLVPDDETGYRAVTKVSITLSCDHRVVDGAVGATFLKSVKELIEEPQKMLL